MPAFPAWSDIVVRLLCTVVAGTLIGFDRGDHGRPAGLRTTLLVALAACTAMIQVNILLTTAGKAPDSFATMDPMRLPLGILSGMGFIGAGAIVRRESGVQGVTTAATLWFVTVIGLCFGGGEIVIGSAGTALGVFVLIGIRPIEARIKQDRLGTLTVVTKANGPTPEEVQASLSEQGYKVSGWTLTRSAGGENQAMTCQLTWRATRDDIAIPQFVRSLSATPGVASVAWTPHLP